ncbi:MAG: PLD nuclease N-terminal domain-containing protein [Deltaproteobacteria bacterium]|nr:PLD nuclease N-terminal domain-containing protein [Deltaproteobacteria bacterium]
MTLETIKFGLLLTFIPFSAIFMLITVCWALMDMALRNISVKRRIAWTLAVIVLPLAGPIAYNYLVRRHTGLKKSSVDGLPDGLCKATN